MELLRAFDVFSDVGSHALGLEAAGGFRTVALVEIDPGRRAFLRHRFRGVHVGTDATRIRAFRGAADILTGGPPCTKTSKGAAIHGKRSGASLWPHMLRIATELDCPWVVVEQPPGHQSWERAVHRDLAAAGYAVGGVEFSAADLGAPHIRRRVFILANPCRSRLALAWSQVPFQIERVRARATAAGGVWHPSACAAVRVHDGISPWVDRDAAVRALGDSNPPQMMEVIGRAVYSAHFARF